MNLNRMKWLAIAMPLAFIFFLRVTTEGALGDSTADWLATSVFFGALAVGVFFFATVIFGWLDRSQKASEARARELQALNELGKTLTGTLDRDAVVTTVLEKAKDLLSPRAVAISLQDEAGASPTWRALGEGKSDLAHVTADMKPADLWERASSQVLTQDGQAAILMSAPMGGNGNRSGVLHVLLPADSPHAPADAGRVMSALANHAAAALDRSRLFDDVRRRERHTRALYEVGLEIVSSQELSRVLRQVTSHACELVHAKSAALCLVNEATGRLSLVQTAGDSSVVLTPARDGREPVAWGVRPRVGDEVGLGCAVLAKPDEHDTIRSPLIVGSNVVGELCVVHEPKQSFTADERALLAGLADMAAIAIHNARLVERERQVAVLEERDNLAREMHDTLAQVLGYLHLKAASTRKRLQSGDVARAEDELLEMEDLANEAYVDVREAILGLRETVATSGGIVGSLRQYLQKFGRQSGLEARLHVSADVTTTLEPESEIQLVRVVQEALTNVRKHAEASSAVVRLDNQDEWLRIAIEDDGQGFDSSRLARDEGRSFGLKSMKERVERAGGTFSVESTLGQGTRIVVLLPLDQGGGRRVPHEDPVG
jgi:signal transduction histidine kinase